MCSTRATTSKAPMSKAYINKALYRTTIIIIIIKQLVLLHIRMGNFRRIKIIKNFRLAFSRWRCRLTWGNNSSKWTSWRTISKPSVWCIISKGANRGKSPPIRQSNPWLLPFYTMNNIMHSSPVPWLIKCKKIKQINRAWLVKIWKSIFWMSRKLWSTRLNWRKIWWLEVL